MWDHLLHQFHLDADILLRLGLTLIAGFLLGLERERHGRAAGLKTTVLVTLAACLVMLISEYYYVHTFDLIGAAQNTWRPDPTRLAAGALSGMGFLGAGVIIHERANVVRGVTTAATLWLATAIGMSFGAGLHGIGVVCTLLAFAILFWLPILENLVQDDWFSDFAVVLETPATSVEAVMKFIEAEGIKISSLSLHSQTAEGRQRVKIHLKHKKAVQKQLALDLTARVSRQPGVRETEWLG